MFLVVCKTGLWDLEFKAKAGSPNPLPSCVCSCSSCSDGYSEHYIHIQKLFGEDVAMS